MKFIIKENDHIMNRFSKVLNILITFLVSYFLMQIINTETLSTNVQRIFIYLYFVVILFIIISILEKYVEKSLNVNKRVEIKALSFILSIIIVFTVGYRIIPDKHIGNAIEIMILDEKNTNSKGYEAILSSIRLNKVIVPLTDVDLSYSEWKYDGNNIIGDSSKNRSEFNLNLAKASSITLKFVAHQWSGIIQIKNGDYTNQYDLYDIAGSEKIVSIPVNIEEHSKISQLIMKFGLIFILSYFIYFVIAKIYLYKWC